MLLSKTVVLKWNSKNVKWYVQRGYNYTKLGDSFKVDVNDLTDGSGVEVNIQCDYCQKKYTKKWRNYIVENRGSVIHKDCCKDCKFEKIKETNLYKYGVENVFCLDETKNKIEKTNMKKYGAKNPFASEIIKEKISNTVFERYGVHQIRKSEKINKKIEKTNLLRYGCKSALGNREIREKIRKTTLDRYGVEYYGFLNKNKYTKENSPLWTGGYKHHKQLRQTDEYRQWRYYVLKRDNYICQCCGFSNVRNDSGVYYLNVHHINSFCDNENLRFDVNNGVTLCVDCHKKLHGEYGNHTTINNYNEFILNHGKKIC